MPELPEVETIRRAIAPRVVGRRIEKVSLYDEKVVEGEAAFAKEVEGRSIAQVGRRGKYLSLELDRGRILVHLRMTGRLLVAEEGEASPAHTRLSLTLSGGWELRFVDPRRFGRVAFVSEGHKAPEGFLRLGVDALSEAFQADTLYALLQGSERPVKAFLLDQEKVAGLGNIYADESLFRAGIHPATPAASLDREEVGRLYAAIREVLRAALAEGGTTFRDYRTPEGAPGGFRTRLAVFGRAGQPCPKCGTPIVKVRIVGRGTHFCPRCQMPGPAEAMERGRARRARTKRTGSERRGGRRGDEGAEQTRATEARRNRRCAEDGETTERIRRHRLE